MTSYALAACTTDNLISYGKLFVGILSAYDPRHVTESLTVQIPGTNLGAPRNVFFHKYNPHDLIFRIGALHLVRTTICRPSATGSGLDRVINHSANADRSWFQQHMVRPAQRSAHLLKCSPQAWLGNCVSARARVWRAEDAD